MKKKLITLLLASIVLTGCGAASRNASSQVYMAETAAAYDTAFGAGNGMPASYSKSATTNFDSEASFDDSDSVQLSENDILSQNPEKIRIQIHLTPKTPLPKLPRRPWNAS